MKVKTISNEQLGYIELTLAMILSGTIGMFVQFSQQPVINLVFYRCIIGSICLLIYLKCKSNPKKRETLPKHELCLVLIAGLAIVINWLALFSAYSYTSIGITTTIYHIQPILVFFAGAILFKEKITVFKICLLLLSVVGVILIINPSDQYLLGVRYFKGCLLALVAAFLYSVATLLGKHIKYTSSNRIVLIQLVIGTFILWPFTKFNVFPKTYLQVSSVFILGVVHSALMYVLLFNSYKKLSSSAIAILSYIYPLVAIVIDYIVFNKTLLLTQILGGGMILIAGLCNKLELNPFNYIKNTEHVL